VATAIYDTIGQEYGRRRRPDPRIAATIAGALGDAQTIINVGAGSGSYEPTFGRVLAVEPSEVMIGQRPPGAAGCVRGVAESLPVETAAFDAAMAVLTLHHWADWRLGLKELRRVAKRRIVILTFDPDASRFWLTEDYFPAITELDRQTMPPLSEIVALVGGERPIPVLVPHDCTDGFLGAYWRRPEAYLDPSVRQSMSGFLRIDPTAGLRNLESDLKSGRWHERNAHLVTLDALDLGYRLVRSEFG
jgi:SAM-dependent methyltransferase